MLRRFVGKRLVQEGLGLARSRQSKSGLDCVRDEVSISTHLCRCTASPWGNAGLWQSVRLRNHARTFAQVLFVNREPVSRDATAQVFTK